MVEVRLDELPEPLRSAINRNRFLFAWSLPERGRTIARHVRADGEREELEFDVALGRVLTPDERRRELPEGGQETIAEEGVTVVSRYSLDARTSELRVELEVIDGADATVLKIRRAVYAPIPWERTAAIREALQERRFPAVYAAWPREQRAAHWAFRLHRLRRAHGEDGREEDEVYSLELVRDLERTDPQVRALLPEILALIADLEQTAPEEVARRFTARTGIVVTLPGRSRAR